MMIKQELYLVEYHKGYSCDNCLLPTVIGIFSTIKKAIKSIKNFIDQEFEGLSITKLELDSGGHFLDYILFSKEDILNMNQNFDAKNFEELKDQYLQIKINKEIAKRQAKLPRLTLKFKFSDDDN